MSTVNSFELQFRCPFQVLQLKADFIQARVQRANVLMKMGRLDEAHIDAENVLRKEPNNEDANR